VAVLAGSLSGGQVGQVDRRRQGWNWSGADVCRRRRWPGEGVGDYVGSARGVLQIRCILADE
jgi:hypothetical protein